MTGAIQRNCSFSAAGLGRIRVVAATGGIGLTRGHWVACYFPPVMAGHGDTGPDLDLDEVEGVAVRTTDVIA